MRPAERAPVDMGLAIALGLRCLRGWHRVGWHKLTGRWPRCKRKAGLGWDGGRPCTSGEMKVALRLVKSWQRKDGAAPEPDYERRKQP